MAKTKRKKNRKTSDGKSDKDRPDWTRSCAVCGQRPVHPLTGMCGPCTFGEADTADGNW
jgi:ribosomal protein L37E